MTGTADLVCQLLWHCFWLQRGRVQWMTPAQQPTHRQTSCMQPMRRHTSCMQPTYRQTSCKQPMHRQSCKQLCKDSLCACSLRTDRRHACMRHKPLKSKLGVPDALAYGCPNSRPKKLTCPQYAQSHDMKMQLRMKLIHQFRCLPGVSVLWDCQRLQP